MYIIGLNLSHDYSACLLKDGQIRFAIALERLVRIKKGLVSTGRLNAAIYELINYCLKAEGIALEEVDYFVANTTETRNPQDEHDLLKSLGIIPTHKMLTFPHPSHHLCHASAAYYTSPFTSNEAAALVVDAYGGLVGMGRESETGFVFSPDSVPCRVLQTFKEGHRVAGTIKDNRLFIPRELQGIGELYRIISLILGFRQPGTYYDDAGKTMGLASYGTPLTTDPQMIRIVDGQLNYDNACIFLGSYNLLSEADNGYYLNSKLPKTSFSQFHKDLASQIQYEVELACVYLAQQMHRQTQLSDVVLSGGVFLNSIVNHRILQDSGFERVFILPAATDDGNAIGCALYAYYHLVPCNKTQRAAQATKHFYLGRTYECQQIEDAICSYGLPYEDAGTPERAAEAAAEYLQQGKIVAWYQGGAEFGPRALGNRSILANPSTPHIKDVLNKDVKFREGFRPFAPAVLTEAVSRYFDLATAESPYMLLICPVRPDYEELLAGIRHIDGTARVQTVDRDTNPLFYHLIEHFGKGTGFPVVLNTSFNLRGMPIVETPEEGLTCFMSSRMDYLIMDRFIIPKPNYGALVPIRRALKLDQVGSWTDYGYDVQHSSVTILGDGMTAHTMNVTVDDIALIHAIDGNHTIAAIAKLLRCPLDDVIDRCFALFCNQVIYWKLSSQPMPDQLAASYFDLSTMPFMQ